MDKKTISIILAILLIVAFFLPYISIPEAEIKLSGYKIIFGKGGLFGSKGVLVYLILLVPIGAVVALLTIFDDGSSNSGLANWLSLIGIIYVTILMYSEMSKGATLAGGSLTISKFISVLGVGYWITLVASVLLPINNSRRV